MKSKAGYYCAAFDEHDVYDIIRPALALPMKRAVTMKAMTAEMTGEAMKTTHVSKIAKVVSDVMVQGGLKASLTDGGLTKDKLLKNKRNEVLWKKTSAACATKRASKIAKDRFAQPAFQGGFSGDLTDDKFDKNKYSRLATFYGGVNEDTTTGGLTLRKLAAKDAQVFPAMGMEIRGTGHTEDANFEERCRAMSAWMACGPGDMGKGCAFALRCANAHVLITESELIGALQVCIVDIQVVTIESVAGEIYIFTSDTGDFIVILLAHKKNMEGFRVVTIESLESDINISTSASDNFNVITLQLMSKIARGMLAKVEVKDELFKNERGKVKSVMSEIDIFTSMAGHFNIFSITHMKKMKITKDELLFAASVNNCMKKPEFDNIYGCRHAPPDGIILALDVKIRSQRALVRGSGDTSKGCALALRGASARVLFTEIGSRRPLVIFIEPTYMMYFQVVTTKPVGSKINIFT